MELTRGKKAAATRKLNYGKKASREHIEEMLRELPIAICSLAKLPARRAKRGPGALRAAEKWRLSGAREGTSSGHQNRFDAVVKVLSNASIQV